MPVPGVNQALAEVIIAEIRSDLSRFATDKHLVSWTGVCPGHHSSAGRTKSAKIRPANPHLKGALGLAACGAARTKDTYLQARYSRLTARRAR